MLKVKWVGLMFAVAFSMVFTNASGAEQSTKQEVKKEVREAAQSIKKFSVEQRDEAVKSTKAALDKMDQRLEQMEMDLHEKWGSMTKSAREKKQDSIQALKKKRQEVAEWYGGLKHGSAKAWEDIKSGFSNAFDSFGDALNRAEKDGAH